MDILEFGEWLKQQRESRNLEQKQVAELTNVDASTLSRIERQKTEPTVDTVLKICRGFGVSLTDLLRDLLGESYVNLLENMSSQNALDVDVLRLSDVENFNRYFSADVEKGTDYLAQLLNTVRRFEVSTSKKPYPFDFSAIDIQKLLVGDSVMHSELAYPSDFDDDWVAQTHQNGGALTLTDVGIYLRGRRKSSRTTLNDIQNVTMRSASVISRIEGGVTGKIKFNSALDLGFGIGEENIVMEMFWQAGRFHEASDSIAIIQGIRVQLLDVSTILITICRWLQVQNRDDTTWLDNFRATIGSA